MNITMNIIINILTYCTVPVGDIADKRSCLLANINKGTPVNLSSSNKACNSIPIIYNLSYKMFYVIGSFHSIKLI